MTKKEYVESHIKTIIELRNQGYLMKDIAQKYGVSRATINRVLLAHNERTRTVKTEYDYQKMITLYQSGQPIYKIAPKYHISEKTLTSIFMERGIQIRDVSHCKQYYSLNEEYFDDINSASKAYILGWLWSDGHNCTTQNLIIISLQEQDKYILEYINQELSSNRPIVFLRRSLEQDYNRQDQYRLTITNKHMSNSLSQIGMKHDKGLTARFPLGLTHDLYPHFIRGYFDGDGWISKNPKDCRMNITGTVWLCESVQTILKDSLNCEFLYGYTAS